MIQMIQMYVSKEHPSISNKLLYPPIIPQGGNTKFLTEECVSGDRQTKGSTSGYKVIHSWVWSVFGYCNH